MLSVWRYAWWACCFENLILAAWGAFGQTAGQEKKKRRRTPRGSRKKRLGMRLATRDYSCTCWCGCGCGWHWTHCTQKHFYWAISRRLICGRAAGPSSITICRRGRNNISWAFSVVVHWKHGTHTMGSTGTRREKRCFCIDGVFVCATIVKLCQNSLDAGIIRCLIPDDFLYFSTEATRCFRYFSYIHIFRDDNSDRARRISKDEWAQNERRTESVGERERARERKSLQIWEKNNMLHILSFSVKMYRSHLFWYCAWFERERAVAHQRCPFS